MKSGLSALLIAMTCAAGAAQAAPVVWSTPDAVTIEAPSYHEVDPVVIHGQFTFDAATNTVSDWAFFEGTRGTASAVEMTFIAIVELAVSGGAIAPVGQLMGISFDPLNPDSCGLEGIGCDWNGLRINASDDLWDLSDAGGLKNVNMAYSTNTFSGNGDTVLTGVPAPAVPLPAGGALLLAGLGTFAVLRRRGAST